MDNIFGTFSGYMNSGESTDSEATQKLVKKLQDYITANFYYCTDDMLARLGEMYVSDERFKKNIDKHAEGTANFVLKAIKIYCNK